MDKKYNHKKIEEKWQAYWREHDTYATPADPDDPEYVLDMFPYPSGSGLHVGHVEGYTGTDVYSRFRRMQGKDVLHPMGWDAFGLPAENYAIKTGTPPAQSTEENIQTYRQQLDGLGLSYDWGREINTSKPEYYGWTQWLFSELFKEGLAERKPAKVNWCPGCQTVLANEQVVDGECERCDSQVVQKSMNQWFFNITNYADELIDDLEKVDWPESTKAAQKNWVGRQEGAHFAFPVTADNDFADLEVFTTRPDTLYGVTFMVVAPEHELVSGSLEDGSPLKNSEDVQAYVKEAEAKTDRDRQEADEKTGVQLEGVTATHPATGEEIPIYVADYVLSDVGTGAIMAVPAHDKRDREFSLKYSDVDIKPVIDPLLEDFESGYFPKRIFKVEEDQNIKDASNEGLREIKKEYLNGQRCGYLGKGKLINSQDFNGLSSEEAAEKITEKFGRPETTYRLRDWSVGRQRFWGCPIPVVYDPEGEAHLVPKKHLPWELPTDVPFEPTGEAPLAQSAELKERTEEIFGEGWSPETSTLDTFVDSSWYWLRFADPENGEEFASSEAVENWCPVDTYVGGAEHSVMHLLYARFITKALADMGHVDFREPFEKLRHQGLIMAEDGTKMSKSKGNVVNPNEVVEQVGADTLRMYELFAGPFAETVEWDTSSIAGPRRFLERVWRLVEKCGEAENLERTPADDQPVHAAVKSVTADIADFKFNTAIATLMELLNDFEDRDEVNPTALAAFTRLLAPFVPHITEELWRELGGKESIHGMSWPTFDEQATEKTSVTIAVQVDGTVRGEVEVAANLEENEVVSAAKRAENVQTWLDGETVERTIYVPGRLVNFVTAG